ncbi:DSBA-like thioredoxin domain-containing protein [Xylaria sp. FL1042]|nr:DSBA-like thioredoxin domain-containing protein [Xylaria sp. FL1042]
MTNFNIKIVSDTVCPWCYVGKRRLDRAIELYRKTYPAGREDTFTVTWAPFYLDPTSPTVGVPIKERIAQKFGTDRVEMMQRRLTMVGREEGINFTFDGRIGNTRDSHRLIQLGKTKGNDVENRVVAELFKSYFEGDGDITSHATLIAAGEKAGLSGSEIKEWLDTGKGGAEVDKEVEEAYAKGVSGVPNITVQGTYNIGGAQDAEVFLETFTKIKEASN